MPKLGSLDKIPPLLTAQQIRSLIGSHYTPCPTCGSAAFSITGRGKWICWGCDWERSQLPGGIVLRVLILFLNGQAVAVDRDLLDRTADRLAAIEAIGAARFEVDEHEWVGWDAEGWGYAARTFGRPIEEIELWIRRTRGLVFDPDENDFRKGSPLPAIDGVTSAWWPVNLEDESTQ